MIGRLAKVFAVCTVALAMGVSGCDDGGTNTPPGSSGPDFDWNTGSSTQKSGYMSSTVVVHMGDLFKDHDATKYANFGCTTCHASADFMIPNPELPPLSQANFPQKGDSAEVDFMYDTVVPEMRALLGLSEAEFGCASCHVVNP